MMGIAPGSLNVEKWILILMSLGAALAMFPDKLSLEESDRYMEHLKTLLSITLGRGSEKSARVFIACSICLGLTVFAFLVAKLSFLLSLLSLAVSTLLPYSLLRMRLERIQVQSSREGEILITELLNNYKIHFFNMREAIEQTALTIEDAPNSKRLLFNLSKGLQRAGTSEEIRKLTNEFRLSINTSWGNILASNMDFALTSGIKVSEAIGDLATTITRARKLEEYSRRENNEARLMLKYLAPIAYLITVISAIFYFDMSPEVFLHYQFGTEVGLTWFIISILMYVTGMVLQSFILKTKLDF